ncbi:T-cell surface glycoprotein YE1/48-like isoform X2 [Mus pahari]|uniref:T-cell surface glycoprotein YE1/48-like isoform X2 n=1 Tax=Mus pahari TaxID=10093 RepID=UPI000A30A000|nr:T-cell surface glycoprotein YE1/48-like isoform X2 [Mus pahari]
MSEEEVTYSTVRFHKSSGLQKQVRPGETKGPREAGYRIPWQLIVSALGILCFLLLVTVSALTIKIFQYVQQKHELQITLKCHDNCTTMLSDINLKHELLKNKAIKHRPGNDLLESLNREQNRWYKETKTVLDSSQHKGRGVEIYWFCYGIKCYYFIMDRKPWSGCKQACQNSSLSLLKIDDEYELKFLKLLVPSDSYWIGLSYDNKKKDWAWIDNGPSKLVLNTMKYNVRDGGCIFLSKTRLDNINCDNSYFCICGKRLDKFPD